MSHLVYGQQAQLWVAEQEQVTQEQVAIAAMDRRLRAFDVKSGTELWRHDLPAPGMAVPMSYMADGRQYVVIAAGGNARVSPELADAIVAFALPPVSQP
mgnify:CR=1 FL=1